MQDGEDLGAQREDLPLVGVRVVDLNTSVAQLTSRYLGDLGAEVLRVDFPREDILVRRSPVAAAVHHRTHNFNKRLVHLDPSSDEGRRAIGKVLAATDILVEDLPPGGLGELGFPIDQLLERHPQLIVVSVTSFGQTGPYAGWAGGPWVHLAMTGALARSRLPGAPPLVPPAELAVGSAAIQAAYAALLAYINRSRTGRGDHIDISLYEMTAQLFDSPFGIAGSAGTEQSRGGADPRGRYPIFRCADGYVRMFVMSARHWTRLREWLGDPPEMRDPALAGLEQRLARSRNFLPVVARFFRDQLRDDIVSTGQSLGIPLAPVLQPGEVISAEHFEQRESFVVVSTPFGPAKVANGFCEIDGHRAGLRHTAIDHQDHEPAVAAWLATAPTCPVATQPTSGRHRPLAGLRVLDLGVMVVGAEMSRLLADQGAEVIKIENSPFADGMRALSGGAMTPTFARGHRNKLSLGLNLRLTEGRDLFARLVEQSDIVLSNFKPGTLESLSLGWTELQKINPRITLVESSALGATGPWSQSLGYGPLLRALTGLTAIWANPDLEDGFYDTVTIYPDHAVPRVCVTAVLAALIRRERTDRGAHVSMAQAETILGHIADRLAIESLSLGATQPEGHDGATDAPQGLYPCLGDDQWCVVYGQGDDMWRRLTTAIGRPDMTSSRKFVDSEQRKKHRADIDAAVAAWTANLSAEEVQCLLQAAGVGAGAMRRDDDLLHDPHLVERQVFAGLKQSGLDEEVTIERVPFLTRHMADPPMGSAPMMGADTRHIAKERLGLTDVELHRYLEHGILEESFSTGP